jgi:uncharacterized protein YecT (DUF1311 family)
MRLKLAMTTLAITLLLLTALAAEAQTGDKRLSPQFAKCMAAVDLGALKNTQFEGCYRKELAVQDQRLNEEYKKALAIRTGESRKLLTNGQRAWLAYRDGWCGYVRTVDAAPTPEVNYVACLVDLTAAQVQHLRDD